MAILPNVDIDLFRQPDCLAKVQAEIERLRMEVEFVKRYEKAKKSLNSSTELNSNTLDKCHGFIAEVNKESSFHAEVSKLTLEELGFASICFEARGLKVINDSFRASKLRDYMYSQHISCLNRKEIFRRLEHYNRSRDNTFGSVYYTAKEEYEPSKKQNIAPAFSSSGMSGTIRQVATYTTAYFLKAMFREYFSDVFIERLERLPIWGKAESTTAMQALHFHDAVVFRIDVGADFTDMDEKDIFRKDGWGSVKRETVTQLLIYCPEDRGQQMVNHMSPFI